MPHAIHCNTDISRPLSGGGGRHGTPMDIHGPPLQILGKGPLVFSLHSEIDPQKGAPGMVFCCFCINIALPLDSFAHFWERFAHFHLFPPPLLDSRGGGSHPPSGREGVSPENSFFAKYCTPSRLVCSLLGADCSF
jgi:hypothetical protein